MTEREDGTIVTVTSKGQATIPREFREKLHIGSPGRVRFLESENGEVVVQPVKCPSELRGDLASEGETEAHKQSATELLREKRERDKTKTDTGYGLSEQEE